MTNVKNVLIYEALEMNKKYKEEKRKKLSDSKRALKLQKSLEKQANTVAKSKIKSVKVSWGIKTRKKKPTGEKEVFERVRKKRFHLCMICNKYITEAQARCFAHLLAKGMYPEYRLHDANIALVCWPECHKAIDSIMVWSNKKVVQLLLETWADFYSIMDVIWRQQNHATDEPWQSQLSGEW